jgi:hypothetical protein
VKVFRRLINSVSVRKDLVRRHPVEGCDGNLMSTLRKSRPRQWNRKRQTKHTIYNILAVRVARENGYSMLFVGVSMQRERIYTPALPYLRSMSPHQAIPRGMGVSLALPASVSPGKLVALADGTVSWTSCCVSSPFSSEPASSLGQMQGQGSDTDSSGA